MYVAVNGRSAMRTIVALIVIVAQTLLSETSYSDEKSRETALNTE